MTKSTKTLMIQEEALYNLLNEFMEKIKEKVKGYRVYPIETKTLKTKPKRIDFIIPPCYSLYPDYEMIPLNKWIYLAEGTGQYWKYWKVRRVVK